VSRQYRLLSVSWKQQFSESPSFLFKVYVTVLRSMKHFFFVWVSVHHGVAITGSATLASLIVVAIWRYRSKDCLCRYDRTLTKSLTALKVLGAALGILEFAHLTFLPTLVKYGVRDLADILDPVVVIGVLLSAVGAIFSAIFWASSYYFLPRMTLKVLSRDKEVLLEHALQLPSGDERFAAVEKLVGGLQLTNREIVVCYVAKQKAAHRLRKLQPIL
jgi:hypothetical protein